MKTLKKSNYRRCGYRFEFDLFLLKEKFDIALFKRKN